MSENEIFYTDYTKIIYGTFGCILMSITNCYKSFSHNLSNYNAFRWVNMTQEHSFFDRVTMGH